MAVRMRNCTIKSFALVTNRILGFLRNQASRHRRRRRCRRNHNRPHPHHPRHLARILFDLIHLRPPALPEPGRSHRI